MRVLLLLSLTLLAGCNFFKQPVPVVPKFPDATPELLKKCENLLTVEGEKVLITDMLKTIVHNYTLYYQCSNKVEGWQEWYVKQKKVFDELK